MRFLSESENVFLNLSPNRDQRLLDDAGADSSSRAIFLFQLGLGFSLSLSFWRLFLRESIPTLIDAIERQDPSQSLGACRSKTPNCWPGSGQTADTAGRGTRHARRSVEWTTRGSAYTSGRTNSVTETRRSIWAAAGDELGRLFCCRTQFSTDNLELQFESIFSRPRPPSRQILARLRFSIIKP